MSIQNLTVSPEHNQTRLDIFLTVNLKDVPSRTYIKKLIEAGRVKVNDTLVKAHHKVMAGDRLEIDISGEILEDETIEPEKIDLDIFYEDDFLIVINKPSGMIVHPAQGCYSGTLVNALLYHYSELSDVNAPTRVGIVHRLDQDTSGLIVAAKDNQTHVRLARLFQKKLVRKQYTALVEGRVEFDEGIIDVPLGRHPKYRDKKSVQFDDSAKDALTRYRVIERFPRSTCVALFPQTGRTHQLRVHMAYLKHSILGDKKYGKKGSFPRLALHATAIGFVHPQYKRHIEFTLRAPKEFFKGP